MIVDDSFSCLTTCMIVHDTFWSAVLVITGPIAVRKCAAAFFRHKKFLLLRVCLAGGHLAFTFLRGKSLKLAALMTMLARLPVNCCQLS